MDVSQKRMPRETASTREKSFNNMKGRVSEISMNSEKMHISIRTRFLASSVQTALHMDPSYDKNLEIFHEF